ncbi:MAG: hypothetical protein IT307_07160 [Chloroflexi bacterium]|nr:hypothetical protein [Chloroflexota bacterium]
MRYLLWAVALTVLLPVPVAAQPPPRLPDPPPEMAPTEVQRLFDAYLIMQAQEALGLSEAQYAPFITRLRTLQDARRGNQRERFQILAQLQRLTDPKALRPADEATVKERLDALQQLESRSAAELRRFYHAIDELLNTNQQARFRIFEEEMERRKLELLLRARENSRPTGNPRRPPPPR